MHHFRFLYLLFFLPASCMMFPSCIDALEFSPTEGEPLLVVDGKLTTSSGVQTLKLTKTAALGRSSNFPPVIGAQVTLRDDLGGAITYTETEPGTYQFNGSDFPIRSGRTYVLNIETEGKRYESKPETIPESAGAEDSFFTVGNQKSVYVYASVPIPENQQQGPFLKWRLNTVFQLGEFFFCYPLDPTNVCYVTGDFGNQLLPLLDCSLLARGETARPFVAVKEADRTFGEVMFFNLYMETLTPEAYKYWNKVSLLLSQSGSFFDAPPGAIRGNMANIDNPEELVLGYFYAAPEDTTHVKVLASDLLPYEINPYCGAPGFPPFPLPTECCTCTLLPNATLEKPTYWY